MVVAPPITFTAILVPYTTFRTTFRIVQILLKICLHHRKSQKSNEFFLRTRKSPQVVCILILSGWILHNVEARFFQSDKANSS